jgi:hypothetical protein
MGAGGNVYLSKAPQMLQAMGLERSQMEWDKTYDPEAAQDTSSKFLSLSKLYVENIDNYAAKDKGRIEMLKGSIQASDTSTIYNSANTAIKLKVLFGQLDKTTGKVAYEVIAEKNDAGFLVETKNKYGLVKSGTLSFDVQTGALNNTGSDETLELKFNNNEQSLNLKLDFNSDGGMNILNLNGGQAGDVQSSQDGSRAADFTGYKVEQGKFIVTYDDSSKRAIYDLVMIDTNHKETNPAPGGALQLGDNFGDIKYINASLTKDHDINSNTKIEKNFDATQQELNGAIFQKRRGSYLSAAEILSVQTETDSLKHTEEIIRRAG